MGQVVIAAAVVLLIPYSSSLSLSIPYSPAVPRPWPSDENALCSPIRVSEIIGRIEYLLKISYEGERTMNDKGK